MREIPKWQAISTRDENFRTFEGGASSEKGLRIWLGMKNEECVHVPCVFAQGSEFTSSQSVGEIAPLCESV